MDRLGFRCGDYDIELECITDHFLALDADVQRARYSPVTILGGNEYVPQSVIYIKACQRGQLIWQRTLASVDGGATGAHEHSAVCYGSCFAVAVGPFIVSLNPANGEVVWTTRGDDVTCFGLHLPPDRKALIVHGELEISKLSPEGKILWHTSGRDIFTGSLSIEGDRIKVVDFEGTVYAIALDDGAIRIVNQDKPYPHV